MTPKLIKNSNIFQILMFFMQVKFCTIFEEVRGLEGSKSRTTKELAMQHTVLKRQLVFCYKNITE